MNKLNKIEWHKELNSLYKEIDAVAPPMDVWEDFYIDDYTPQEAFNEEVSNWDD